MMRKAQSTHLVGSRYEEESKGGGDATTGRRSSDFMNEPPPKDCNERIERLLARLESAAKSTDFKEAHRQLRYLDEFELISGNYSYKDDQIKRALIVSYSLSPRFSASCSEPSLLCFLKRISFLADR